MLATPTVANINHEASLAHYGNLPYNPPTWPDRPSTMLDQGRLGDFIPSINFRRDLREFLSRELPYNSDQASRDARNEARGAFLDHFKLNKIYPFSLRIPIKVVIHDVDDNEAKLYAPVNAANAWFFTRLADRHHVALDAIQPIVKGTMGEFGCHAPYELAHLVANKMNNPNLSPDNKENWDLVADWRYARLALTSQALFKETIPSMQDVKFAGGLVYQSTASMPASLIERNYLWFGNTHIDLIDGIAVSKTMPGIPDVSIFATQEERNFAERLKANGRLYKEVDLDKVKPHPEHVQVCLDHANLRRPEGAPVITPGMCVLADDSPGALGAARGAGMHTALNLKAVLTDEKSLREHELWGCNRNERGLPAFMEKYKRSGENDIPIRNLGQLSEIVEIVPAYSSSPGRPVEALAWKNIVGLAPAQ